MPARRVDTYDVSTLHPVVLCSCLRAPDFLETRSGQSTYQESRGLRISEFRSLGNPQGTQELHPLNIQVRPGRSPASSRFSVRGFAAKPQLEPAADYIIL